MTTPPEVLAAMAEASTCYKATTHSKARIEAALAAAPKVTLR